jgi:hypothetical protein
MAAKSVRLELNESALSAHPNYGKRRHPIAWGANSKKRSVLKREPRSGGMSVLVKLMPLLRSSVD